MGYGTGAIMAVPGQDVRDWEFAEKFSLPIIRTVQPAEGHPDNEAFTGEGLAINSANDEVSLNGLHVAEAKSRIIAHLEDKGLGEGTVNYRIRDWLFSRQRYWGEPFPIMFDDDGVSYPVPDDQLPLTLPDVPDYSPKTFDPDDAEQPGAAPVARAGVGQRRAGPGGRPGSARLPPRDEHHAQLGGILLVLLPLPRPGEPEAFVDPANEAYWLAKQPTAVEGAPAGTRDPGGVDLYVGGVEHAVLHLLYARFWHKVLFDLGHVQSEEPFRTYFAQGYIQAYAYTDSRGQYVPAADVIEEPGKDGQPTYVWDGQLVGREYGKIGKSLKNMVSPDDMYDSFGADTFRVYEMSMGPLECPSRGRRAPSSGRSGSCSACGATSSTR